VQIRSTSDQRDSEEERKLLLLLLLLLLLVLPERRMILSLKLLPLFQFDLIVVVLMTLFLL
jgi:hypothetical protein